MGEERRGGGESGGRRSREERTRSVVGARGTRTRSKKTKRTTRGGMEATTIGANDTKSAKRTRRAEWRL